MASARLWAKMIGVGAVLCIGGPALVMYVSPTEEELFKRYNPELQKRSLANRQKNQDDFNQLAVKMREYSKSNKSMWEAAAEDEERKREQGRQDIFDAQKKAEALREEIRRSHGSN